MVGNLASTVQRLPKLLGVPVQVKSEALQITPYPKIIIIISVQIKVQHASAAKNITIAGCLFATRVFL
jgi:hypothetical protein